MECPPEPVLAQAGTGVTGDMDSVGLDCLGLLLLRSALTQPSPRGRGVCLKPVAAVKTVGCHFACLGAFAFPSTDIRFCAGSVARTPCQAVFYVKRLDI